MLNIKTIPSVSVKYWYPILVIIYTYMCTKIIRVNSHIQKNRLLVQVKINCLQLFWFPHSRSFEKGDI